MKQLKYFIVLLLVFSLKACTIFKKEIKKPVVVKIVAPQDYTTLNTSVNYLKYVTAGSGDYQNKFMENLISEGKITKNVTINNESLDPDFIIEVKGLSITETEFSQTVNDAQSPYNGQTFFLNKVEASCNVIVLNAKTNKQIGLNCSNIKSREEKLKNNRSLGDLVVGTNKDRKTYREKNLRDDIALDLASDVGRRIWVPITRRIRKGLK